MSDFSERHAFALIVCAAGALLLFAGGVIVSLIN